MFLLIIVCLSILSCALSCFSAGVNHVFTLLYLLPLSFGILSILSWSNIRKLSKYHSFIIIYLIMIIRYVIAPIGYSIWGKIESRELLNTDLAILIMVYEQVMVFFVFIVIVNIKLLNIPVHSFLQPVSFNNFSRFYFVFCAVCLMFMPGLIAKYNFVWNLGDDLNNKVVETDDKAISGVFAILILIGRQLLIFTILSFLYINALKVRNKRSFVWLSLGLILLSSSIVAETGRFSILLVNLPLIIVLGIMYPNHKLKLWTISGVFLVLSIFIVTIYKFYNISYNNTNALSFISFDPNLLNAYFSGPFNVSIALDAFDNSMYSLNPGAFFNDNFSSVAFISHFTNSSLTSSELFNHRFYGNYDAKDQIIPMIGIGRYHFGLFFSPLYSIVFSFMAFYFEYMGRKSQNIGFTTVYYSIGIFFASFMMVNSSILFSSFINGFCFTMVILHLNEIFSNRKRIYRKPNLWAKLKIS